MKKQFTLLAGVLLASGAVMAQAPAVQSAKAAPKAITPSKKVVNTTPSVTKAEGDQVWASDFSDATEWTVATAGQGTWVIGTTTSQADLGNGTQGLGTGYGYGANAANFTALTKNNGFAGFNGVKFLLQGTVTPQSSTITSEAIDFTGKSVVTVNFYQWYRAFNYDDVYFEYSADNGVTWTNSTQLNVTVAGNTSTTGLMSVDFNSLGSANGKIRFRWDSNSNSAGAGSGYGWAIDDVTIIEGAANKLNIVHAYNTILNAAGEEEMIKYTKFPASQVTGNQEITFGAEVQNVGSAAQTATLYASTTGYNESGASSSIASFGSDSLSVEDGYTIPATPGVHNFVVAVGSANDLSNSSDSAKTLKFEVTSSIMAVDSYDGTSASFTGSFGNWSTQTEGDFTGIGNIFTTYNTGVVGAVQVGFDEVSDESVYVGRPFTVNILKFETGTGWVLFNQTDAEMQSSYFGALNTVYLTEAFNVAAGETYAVIVGSFVGSDNSGGVPVAFAGTNLAGNTVGTNDINFESLISLMSDELTPNIVDAPVVRLDFTDYTSVNEISKVAGEVTVSPNPFAEQVAINFTLSADANVSVVITDLSGRAVMTVPASTMNAGKQSVSIDGSAFKAGVYNYTLTVDGNSVTKRIVKK